MTGFGEAKTSEDGVSYRVEIRSVNNRYFKATIKMPESMQRFETEIDKLLRAKMGRGSVTFNLRLRDDRPAAAYAVNTAMVGAYIAQLRSVSAESNGGVMLDVGRLLEIPGVLMPPQMDEEDLTRQFAIVERLTNEAADRLIEMRKVEGQTIANDLAAQCAEIRRLIEDVAERSPTVVDDYRKRLKNRLEQLLGGVVGGSLAPHEDAIAREVAIYSERCDINEELSRIRSHLDQFAALCAAPEETGRKLDFLSQELLREANTIGSKSADVTISQNIVSVKAAIDRIKEQVQNVE
ncbi:MAG: YicC family protein [Phycisphaerales bacterium]|nr:YicC family protein [Phycisphaerales bacterium]